ncbi:hypothetical protein POM88_030508 [Heracleum sosnowskyi]|uniref:GMPS ATP-PPase domain-containing protein n=1 Tax=Heracleum sosnowskyi TaxID=360622 RepID=A0AAD8HW22_9APIA|nr:hypothetical protein POM88_030508 [Heracleum sosnowskyi]
MESCPPPGSGRTHSHTIKSHHNVGGLPKDMKLKLIEPLKLLFKDEVRKLGKILNVPVPFLKRHPFHGPGLDVRVLGDVTEGNALDILRQAKAGNLRITSFILRFHAKLNKINDMVIGPNYLPEPKLKASLLLIARS